MASSLTKEKAMTYANKVVSWRLSAPVAYVNIGRFTLTYQYGFERDWGSGWICWAEPDGFDNSPEATYLEELLASDANKGNFWADATFIDELLKLIEDNPFKGE
jgi:hypothetical protein